MSDSKPHADRYVCAHLFAFALLLAAAPASAIQFVEAGSIAAPPGVTQIAYAPAYNTLAIRNSGSAVTILNTVTGNSTLRLANVTFTDLTLAADGRHLFVADYGGESYGGPSAPSYVHRLDLATMTWEAKTSSTAYHVQPVSPTQVILKSYDQWVSFTNNAWTAGPALQMLSTPPSFYALAYYGNFRYVPGTGRLIHGNWGSSSSEVKAYKLIGNEFSAQEETGIYGTAQGYGGSTVLSTDGISFYYGRLQVDTLDVRVTKRTFPEIIYAASAGVAFGSAAYYDALTGLSLGTLGFPATIYALNPNGQELWVYDPGQARIRRFVNDALGGAACGTGFYPFPFGDVAAVGNVFCPGIFQAYVLGVTRGTGPTTFSPDALVPRAQMTTFLQRTFDQATKRTLRRSALGQWWSAESTAATRSYPVSGVTRACASDGEHVWVPLAGSNEVAQVQASTGRILGTWTGANGAGGGALVAAGRVFVTSQGNAALYAIDPSQPPGAVAPVASLPSTPASLAFDGARIWSANASTISIVPLTAAPPYASSTAPAAITAPGGILFDGVDIWVTDRATNRLLRLDASGAIMQSVGVGISPREPVFDGANIWVPNAGDNSISVVVAQTGALVTTIKSNPTNRLDAPTSASFDGERILVTNTSGNSVSVFRAADLSFIASVDTGAASAPQGTCSDGGSFWVGLGGVSKLMRY